MVLSAVGLFLLFSLVINWVVREGSWLSWTKF